MVNFALQFLGNPYVWGGTSLTNGCDCSGFVQSIYAYYGYSLPRVADAQSGYGMQIPISSAQPGDLIFYAKNGYVYHVSMYIGNGQVVHAAGRKLGIITSGISGNAVLAQRGSLPGRRIYRKKANEKSFDHVLGRRTDRSFYFSF
ncbi:MAG: C40 family peptidase [Lachnospiraceae bacterium]